MFVLRTFAVLRLVRSPSTCIARVHHLHLVVANVRSAPCPRGGLSAAARRLLVRLAQACPPLTDCLHYGLPLTKISIKSYHLRSQSEEPTTRCMRVTRVDGVLSLCAIVVLILATANVRKHPFLHVLDVFSDVSWVLRTFAVARASNCAHRSLFQGPV